MALNPADIAVVSQLLDQVMELPPEEQEAWLAALPAEQQRHVETLRDMLAQEAALGTDPRLDAMPKIGPDESVAHKGDLVGPYRLLHEIGRGGMGSVWLAERADGAYKRQVALKLPRLAWGAGLAERMAREREIGMLLEHPAIARLYDAGVDERGRPYLALEFVDGQAIDAWCEAQGLSVRDRLRLFVQVARAVAYAHGRLVVHRDLKPSNVLVTPDGHAHLLDFGIAKLLSEVAPGQPGLTQEQGRVMTPHYASPEQVAGEAITVQSDVYSLGVLLYELLTNTLPIAPRRSTLGAVEEAILAGDAPSASSRVNDRAIAKALRGEVDAILAMAMQREPARRYATADAMALDIERHLKGETVAARPDSMGYRLRKGLRRHWVGASAVSAVMVAVLTGSGVAVVQAKRAARSAERERVVKEFVSDVFRVNSKVDPRNAALRPVTTQALLEGGAQLIQQRFAGQPELQAELYGVVGGVFSDMGAYSLAVDYSTKRVETLSTLGAEDLEQARAVLALAQAMFDDGKYADAQARVARVLQMTGRTNSVYLDALALLGRIHDAESRLDEMRKVIDEIDALVATQGTAPSIARAWAVYLRAEVMNLDNRFDEALPLFQQAIGMAVLTEGRLSLAAIAMRINLAHRLVGTSGSRGAQEQFSAASEALRELGGAHAVRASFQTARFVWRMRITADEAVAQLQRSRDELAASPLPVPSWYLQDVDFSIGSVLSRHGNLTAGWPLMENSAASLKRTRTLTLGGQLRFATSMGIAAMNSGRHELAGRLLQERMDLRKQQGEGSHPWAASDYWLIAQNFSMQGRLKEAESVLDKAPKFDSLRGDSSPNVARNGLMRTRALVRLLSNDTKTALQLLETARPDPGASANTWSTYNEALGEVACQAGRPAQGLMLLKLALAHEESNDNYVHSPELAHLRSKAGLCALDTGDRSLALNLAAKARTAFAAQPEVSPFFKATLIRLERALGLHLPPV